METAVVGQMVLSMGVGALIGYVTNAIAIKMLFRPHRQIKLGPMVLPFTPGIIPKQRDRLANSIARMVSTALFSRESIVRHIESPVLRDKVRAGVREALGSLSDPGRSGTVKGEGDAILEAVFGNRDHMKQVLSDALDAFVRSPRFLKGLEGAVSGLVRYLDGIALEGLLPPSGERDRLLAALGAEGAGAQGNRVLGRIAELVIDDLAARDESLDQILGAGFAKGAADFFDRLYPDLRDFLVQWLGSPAMRAELTSHGRVILKEVLEKLSATQRILVGMVGYDRRLDGMMPGIIDDVLVELEKLLAKDVTRNGLRTSLAKGLARHGAMTPAQILEHWGIRRRRLVALVHRHFRTAPGPRTLMSSWVGSLLALAQRNGDMPLGQALSFVLGMSREDLGARAVHLVVDWVARPAAAARLFGIALDMVYKVAALADVPESEESGALSVREHRGADAAPVSVGSDRLVEDLSGAGIRILGLWLPQLVEKFDVEAMVRNRIMELDMKQLETMILDIARKELQWINILGAILGAFIGLIQVLGLVWS